MTSLTPTSYVVLGLLVMHGPLTPYEMKQRVDGGVGYLWTFPHSQLYSEPARLRAAGLVSEERETTGRRRRRFAVTPAGRRALKAWLAADEQAVTEIRDPALLKLFFADVAKPGDVTRLATAQAAVHKERLAAYVDIDRAFASLPTEPYARTTLQLGLAYERAAVAFWSALATEGR